LAQLVTQGVLSPLANVCDTNYASVAKFPKKYLPPGVAMGGADARLRSIAAEYRRLHPWDHLARAEPPSPRPGERPEGRPWLT